MRIMFILKWKNKYSDETGLVGRIIANDIDYKGYHFVSVSSAHDAKKYKTEEEAEKAIEQLKKYGEAENNLFIVTSLGGD